MFLNNYKMLVFGDRADLAYYHFVADLCSVAWIMDEVFLASAQVLLVLRMLRVPLYQNRRGVLHRGLNNHSRKHFSLFLSRFHILFCLWLRADLAAAKFGQDARDVLAEIAP